LETARIAFSSKIVKPSPTLSKHSLPARILIVASEGPLDSFRSMDCEVMRANERVIVTTGAIHAKPKYGCPNLEFQTRHPVYYTFGQCMEKGATGRKKTERERERERKESEEREEPEGRLGGKRRILKKI